jgi:hypothetical protein
MKRIYAFDLIRGIAIACVVVFHRIVWDYYADHANTFSTLSTGETVLFLFITMAGIFYCISGFVNSYIFFDRYQSKKNSLKQLLMGGIITGLILIAFEYIFSSFLLRSVDDVVGLTSKGVKYVNSTSLVSYLIQYGKLPSPLVNPDPIINIGTLDMIGITAIFVSIVMYLGFKKIQENDTKPLIRIFGILGIIIFGLSLIFRMWFGEFSSNALANKNYLVAFFTQPLINGLFPVFPFLAYGCFGAMFGLMYAREKDITKITKPMLISSILLFIVGVLTFTGFTTPFTWAGTLNLASRRILQLGLFFFWFWLGMKFIDSRSEKVQMWWQKYFGWLMDLGQVSLTIYMFEGVLASILDVTVGLAWLDRYNSAGSATLFGLFCLGTWILIVQIWKKYDYKYSMEWILVWVVKKFSGKESSRLAAKRVLNEVKTEQTIP